jgi:hypothetical protein
MRQMIMARYSVLLVVLFAVASVGRAQSEEQSSVQKPDTRSFSIYTGLGYPEIIALSVQYQINDKFALGVKAVIADFGKGGRDEIPMGSGVGIKGSYFFSRTGERTFLSTNVVNIESSYLFGFFEEGRSAEFTIGHDSIEGRGIGVLWSIGMALGAPAGRPLVIFLAAKIGLHVDL